MARAFQDRQVEVMQPCRTRAGGQGDGVTCRPIPWVTASHCGAGQRRHRSGKSGTAAASWSACSQRPPPGRPLSPTRPWVEGSPCRRGRAAAASGFVDGHGAVWLPILATVVRRLGPCRFVQGPESLCGGGALDGKTAPHRTAVGGSQPRAAKVEVSPRLVRWPLTRPGSIETHWRSRQGASDSVRAGGCGSRLGRPSGIVSPSTPRIAVATMMHGRSANGGAAAAQTG